MVKDVADSIKGSQSAVQIDLPATSLASLPMHHGLPLVPHLLSAEAGICQDQDGNRLPPKAQIKGLITSRSRSDLFSTGGFIGQLRSDVPATVLHSPRPG